MTTDNGYVLRVNGAVVEEAQPSQRRGGFFNRQVEYKSIPVVEGQTYDITVEYRRGNGNFALLRADFCERHLADFTQLAEEARQADAIIVIGGISAQGPCMPPDGLWCWSTAPARPSLSAA